MDGTWTRALRDERGMETVNWIAICAVMTTIVFLVWNALYGGPGTTLRAAIQTQVGRYADAFEGGLATVGPRSRRPAPWNQATVEQAAVDPAQFDPAVVEQQPIEQQPVVPPPVEQQAIQQQPVVAQPVIQQPVQQQPIQQQPANQGVVTQYGVVQIEVEVPEIAPVVIDPISGTRVSVAPATPAPLIFGGAPELVGGVRTVVQPGPGVQAQADRVAGTVTLFDPALDQTARFDLASGRVSLAAPALVRPIPVTLESLESMGMVRLSYEDVSGPPRFLAAPVLGITRLLG